MQNSIRVTIANWLLGQKAGNWQQLFDRGASESDGNTGGIQEPYRNSPWVQRGIKLVADPVSSSKLYFTLNEKEVNDPKLEQYWESPVVALDSFSEFVFAWVGWLKLYGEAFLIGDDTWVPPLPGVLPRSKLILAPPPSMKELCVNGELVGWEYTDAAKVKTRLPLDQVYQAKLWNPYNPHRGLGELEAALLAADADYQSGKYETNLAKNSGDQGFVVSTDGALPSKEQVDQILTQLRRKRERLLRGEYTDLFLAAGVNVTSPTPTGADLAFQSARVTKRHEIAVAFGVPPSLFDVKASYSYGKDSDYRALLVNTCLPTANKLAAVITKLSQRFSGKPLRAALSFDDNPVMQEVQTERITSARALWDMGVPLKDAGEYLEMDLPRVPGDEIGYLPFSVAPVGSDLAPENDPNFSEDSGDEPVQEMVRALRCGKPSRQIHTVHECGIEPRADLSPSEMNLWRKQMLARRKTERAYASKFSRVLMDARAEVLSKLAGGKRDPGASFMFDLLRFTENLFKGMRGITLDALQSSGQLFLDEIGNDDPWKVPPQKALDFVSDRENKLSGVPQDVFERIRGRIEGGLKDGQSTDEIAKAIRGEFNAIDKERGKIIAITETGAAYNYARQEAMVSANITRKKWLSSGNPNMRPAHAEANGQEVGVYDPFTVGGETLAYPGDPSGSPENVINCRCLSVAVEAAEYEVKP